MEKRESARCQTTELSDWPSRHCHIFSWSLIQVNLESAYINCWTLFFAYFTCITAIFMENGEYDWVAKAMVHFIPNHTKTFYPKYELHPLLLLDNTTWAEIPAQIWAPVHILQDIEQSVSCRSFHSVHSHSPYRRRSHLKSRPYNPLCHMYRLGWVEALGPIAIASIYGK